MSSEKQIAASRANGKLSRGPVTDEGKAICSRNAERHGLLSNTIVLPGESEERFRQLLTELVLEHCPANVTEMNLVENLAVAQWRRRRLLGIETAGIGEEIHGQGSSPCIVEKAAVVRASLAIRHMTDNSRFLDLMNRYDARMMRECHKIEQRLSVLKEALKKSSQK
jgi:hypothetical protein